MENMPDSRKNLGRRAPTLFWLASPTGSTGPWLQPSGAIRRKQTADAASQHRPPNQGNYSLL